MTANILKQYLPILNWLPGYDRKAFSADGMAGLIVAIMLVPQGMAYALLAGLPPEVGLYASILPLALSGLLGSSRALAVGPVAIVSLMVASTVGAFAESGSPDYIAAAIMLAALSGVRCECPPGTVARPAAGHLRVACRDEWLDVREVIVDGERTAVDELELRLRAG